LTGGKVPRLESFLKVRIDSSTRDKAQIGSGGPESANIANLWQ
jgi:hypothetical protein